MKNVLLCGCGNIGFRHLQAMAAMPDPVAITIVEPNLAAHDRIAAFTASAQQSTGHRFILRPDVPAPRTRFDLVVIATSADTRRAAFDSIVHAHDVGVMILEKVLFQHTADLDAVGDVLNAHGIAAFVNCARRYFPGYQSLKTAARNARPLDLTITGAGFGLASNGIHLIDLAEFLNGADLISLDASGLLKGSVPAKRAGCIEVFGHLNGTLSNGARLSITCNDLPEMAVQVSLQGKDFTAEIDEIARTICIDEDTAAFASKFVSETWEIYHEALTTGQTALTPYADSVRQHRLFLSALSGHLGLADSTPCPIS